MIRCSRYTEIITSYYHKIRILFYVLKGQCRKILTSVNDNGDKILELIYY
jgi:hypothetical protein